MSARRWNPSIARVWDPEPTTLQVGAHLVFDRGWYEHHVLYMGNGKAVEYHEKRGVHVVSLDDVIEHNRYWELGDDDRKHPALFTGPEAMRRALARLGERQYDAGENNCEHFLNWALSGHHHCDQTDRPRLAVLGFLSWLLDPQDQSWHRKRLAREFPAQTTEALRRQAAYRALLERGHTTVDAARAVRRGVPGPRDNVGRG